MKQTKPKSEKSLTVSSSRSKKPKQTRLGREIIAGLKEGVEFLCGEVALPVRLVHVPDPVDVKSIREHLALSQAEFAQAYGFNPRTVQEWEQGRATPDLAVRAYLTVIERNPEAVRAALIK
ncbi:MAG: helix-turn-helix domain-containing protein [Acidobacteriota bacterium]|nr:helix-turn-helix domain-containing protein [Acidobacteriota bacterium]